MTIIAWKDGVMAADTMLSTQFGIKTGTMSKIASGKCSNGLNFIVGFAGERKHFEAVVRWVEGSPEVLPASGYTALVAFADDRLSLVEDGASHAIPYNEPRAAGAGAELAYGAMFAGANAVQAAELCVERSIYCGGSVECAMPHCGVIKVHG